jgi:hypothetical protein
MSIATLRGSLLVLSFLLYAEGNVVDLTPNMWERYVVNAEHGKDTVVLFYVSASPMLDQTFSR